MTSTQRDGGSYRDPGGYVFYQDGRVYRAIMERARADYEAVREIPLVGALIRSGVIVGSRELEPEQAKQLAPEAAKRGEWRWRREAVNGNIIGAASEGYKSKGDAVANAERQGYSA
jgi:hypothetical protein